MRDVLRVLRTLAPLSAKQISYLVRNRLFPVSRAHPVTGPHVGRPWVRLWQGRRWRAPAFGAGTVTFLNVERPANFPALWHDPSQSDLWRYHLHYLDDLDAEGAENRRFENACLLHKWIAQNPQADGVGWEPYPLSIRITNIVKFFASAEDAAPGEVALSLAQQASALEKRIEHHLRANHLFENAKALLFAGTFLEGGDADRWLDRALEILKVECLEQFLADGGHFERSPMYHAIMLWNLCDLVELAAASGHERLVTPQGHWRDLARSGLDWYRAMSHPDGQLSFFNDSAMGQAPSYAQVADYCCSVGIAADAAAVEDKNQLAVLVLPQSGYVRMSAPGAVAILDVAPVGPAYQPGHAHADTLSFELSLFGQRVFVNSGTSTYQRGAERERQRSTAAHNTVCVDGVDSSETWAGFRVGRRARAQLVSMEKSAAQVIVRAMHDGYRRWTHGVIHHRSWLFSAHALRIVDHLEGRFRSATAHLFLHPSVRIERSGDSTGSAILTLPDGRTVIVQISGGRTEVVPSHWYPSFGTSIANHELRAHFDNREVDIDITWA